MGDTIDNGMNRAFNKSSKSEQILMNEKFDTMDGSVENRELLSNRLHINETVSEENDWPPEFSKIDFLLLCVGVFLFLLDIASDWRLAVSYYIDNNLWLFYVSAGFIAVPSFFSGILSIVWYIMEEKNHDEINQVRVVFRVLFSFLQLGRAYRSVETLYLMAKGWRAHESRKKHLRIKTINHMQDAAILELFDGFLESALQLVLQLYLTLSVPIKLDLIRGGTLLLSLASTAWIKTSYYRTNRISKRDKKNVGYVGSAFYFLWRICEIGPRILLISLCIYSFYPWCFIPIAFHFMFMFGYFCHINPELSGVCHHKFCNYPFLLLMSYIGIFCFMNLKDGETKRISIIYYIVFYTENVLMTVLIIWYAVSEYVDLGVWTYSSMCFVPGGLFQVAFMFVFYRYFHPIRRR